MDIWRGVWDKLRKGKYVVVCCRLSYENMQQNKDLDIILQNVPSRS